MSSLFRRVDENDRKLSVSSGRRPSLFSKATVVDGANSSDRRLSSITPRSFLNKRKSVVAASSSLSPSRPECLLLTRLPYELRELIYIALVETEANNKDETDHDWMALLKEVADDPKWRKKLRRRRKQQRAPEFADGRFSTLLCLMTTCRFIHQETQPLLLRRTRIRCPSQSTMEAFTFRLPVRIMSQIRHLELDATFPHLLFCDREPDHDETIDTEPALQTQFFDFKNWTFVCSALVQMTGLWVLRLNLKATDYRSINRNWADRPSRRLSHMLLDPLMEIKWCKDFAVETSWPLDGLMITDAPFTMRQRKSTTG